MPEDSAPPVLHDRARLAALSDTELLDSFPEESFDRLTRLVASVLGVPISLVSLVDHDRQFFKSLHAPSQSWANRRETPLSHSFCQHVVESGNPLVVEDARIHPLLKQNLAIPDLGVIAYAGMPLSTQEGHTLGTLCAIDTEPRQWSDEDLAALRDLAALAMTELQLRAELRRRREIEDQVLELAAIVESSDDAILGKDLEGIIRSWNQGAERMYGYSVGEVLGRPIRLLVPPERHQEVDEILTSIRHGIKVEHFETERVRKNGERFPVSVTVSPIRNGDGEIVGASATARDISDRRDAERRKDEFRATVVHEFRTPLTSMRGSIGLLASGKLGVLPDATRRVVDIAARNTDRLLALINDFLESERIAAGQVVLDRQPVDAADLLHAAADAVQGFADQYGIPLLVRPEHAEVYADAFRVHQVLTNLVSNAIKFSPAGAPVELAADVGEGEVRFRVTDRGRGIPAEKLDRIFERFGQADTADRREKSGTGLGLAIARSLVEQHGGRIWVESQPGVGSTFFFTLPRPSP